MRQGFNFFKSKLFLSILLFFMVFIPLAFCIKDLWFATDDLGNIIEGIIRNWGDFIRVFTEDERNYIYPINFNVPKANLVSAFYRPMQHIPFTITYYLFGFNAYAFYIVNVLFHALNSVLFFYLLSFWLPLGLSFVGGLLLAFNYSIGWITWISTLHNLMAIFFLLLSLLFYRSFLFGVGKKINFYLAGLMFFFSIISRENTLPLGFWLFVGVYLFYRLDVSFWQRLKYAFEKTWIFFVAYFAYVLIRLSCFGFGTFDRTLYNLYLKIPFVAKFFATSSNVVLKTTSSVANQVQTTGMVASNVVSTVKSSFFMERFWAWSQNLVNVSTSSWGGKFLILFLIGFMIFSFRKNIKLLFFLSLGALFFSWPGLVAYLNARYISGMYPFVVSIFLFGVYFFQKSLKNNFVKKIVMSVIYFLIILAVSFGLFYNVRDIKSASASLIEHKKDTDVFFQENSFKQNANFVLFGIPFYSDIKNIFQVYLNNLDLKLAHVRISTLALAGSMGCRGDYKKNGVRSKIIPIKKDEKFGFRLTSLDYDHCGWWQKFSFFPLRWSANQKAYVWTSKESEVGIWHEFSMGKFLIHERLDNNVITDMTIVFDDKWIDENTVFVTWDTMESKFKVLSL